MLESVDVGTDRRNPARIEAVVDVLAFVADELRTRDSDLARRQVRATGGPQFVAGCHSEKTSCFVDKVPNLTRGLGVARITSSRNRSLARVDPSAATPSAASWYYHLPCHRTVRRPFKHRGSDSEAPHL